MAFTDVAVFIFSTFFLIRGYSAGFVNSLLGPFSIIIGTLISVIYYETTSHLLTSLALGLLAPVFLYGVLKAVVKMWSKATDTDVKPNFISSVAGAVLNLVWGWVFIVLFLLLMAFLPPMGRISTAVHDDVLRSASYAAAKPWQEVFFPFANKNAAGASGNTDDDVQSLSQDPRFRGVLHDPQIQHDIDTHNIVKLMNNPKIMELTKQILSDPATFKKVLAIYQSRQKQLGAQMQKSGE
ncbi:MAG: CvpA family protein [Candidatus Omnitrophica bacterium]|nr:CvpA family protein [Candidatus Omnitrophota bacterium]